MKERNWKEDQIDGPDDERPLGAWNREPQGTKRSVRRGILRFVCPETTSPSRGDSGSTTPWPGVAVRSSSLAVEVREGGLRAVVAASLLAFSRPNHPHLPAQTIPIPRLPPPRLTSAARVSVTPAAPPPAGSRAVASWRSRRASPGAAARGRARRGGTARASPSAPGSSMRTSRFQTCLIALIAGVASRFPSLPGGRPPA